MDVKITLNGKVVTDSVDADMVLLDFCRKHNCYSVKRGCESGNCGLCTVLLDGKPILSCSTPVGRANGRRVDTLEGLQEEAKAFTRFFAAQGADQCGFCNPGYIVNIVALLFYLHQMPIHSRVWHLNIDYKTECLMNHERH